MARGNILGREENGVTVFDEPVLGEENYVSPPPPVFDGPNGLPTGWTRIEFSFSGRRVKGAMFEKAAVMPVPGEWEHDVDPAGSTRRSAGRYELSHRGSRNHVAKLRRRQQ